MSPGVLDIDNEEPPRLSNAKERALIAGGCSRPWIIMGEGG